MKIKVRQHRRLRPVQVISFDLDDTLYDNKPVMRQAEQALVAFMQQHWPATRQLQVADWRRLREQLAQQQSELAHDMTALRLATLEQGLVACGYPPEQARTGARAAMEYFLQERNKVTVPTQSHTLLSHLGQHFPLVAISNGNVDIHQIGLADYFVGAWQPGAGLRGKPHADLFHAASDAVGLNRPEQLLHVGDHPEHDILGAARFGAQTAWLPISEQQPGPWLPTVELHQVADLSGILTGHWLHIQ